jgi:hypothetical protein
MSKTATLSHLAFRNKLARTREPSRVYFEAKYQEISWHMCGLRDFNIYLEKHACVTISSSYLRKFWRYTTREPLVLESMFSKWGKPIPLLKAGA